MRWILYNVLFAIAYAAMMPKFLLRMKKRGGYRAHFAERFGRYDPGTARRLAEKPRVWVHAVSVGEANLAGQVLAELRRRDPAASFVLSTTSSTGRAVCERLVGPDDVCVYLPLDFPPCVRRALRAANVRAMVLVEAELWPNLLRALRRRGVPILLANGRISDRSAPGYRRLRFFFGPVLRLFDALLVQSELDRGRLLAAGAPADRTRVTGSIKFDVAPPAPEKIARARETLACAGIVPSAAAPGAAGDGSPAGGAGERSEPEGVVQHSAFSILPSSSSAARPGPARSSPSPAPGATPSPPAPTRASSSSRATSSAPPRSPPSSSPPASASSAARRRPSRLRVARSNGRTV